MEENVPVAQSAQVSGGGTISGPGKNKTPFIAAGIIFLVLLTGSALFVQQQVNTPKTQPTPEAKQNQPIRMETFNKDQVEHPVTAENAAETAALKQAELQYGLDKESLRNEIISIFANSL